MLYGDDALWLRAPVEDDNVEAWSCRSPGTAPLDCERPSRVRVPPWQRPLRCVSVLGDPDPQAIRRRRVAETTTKTHSVRVAQRSLLLSWAGVTDVGRRRETNQDAFFADYPLFIVADGMGGHAGGAVSYTHLTLPTNREV